MISIPLNFWSKSGFALFAISQLYFALLGLFNYAGMWSGLIILASIALRQGVAIVAGIYLYALINQGWDWPLAFLFAVPATVLTFWKSILEHVRLVRR